MIIAKALGNLRFTFFSLNSTPATLAAYLLILGFFEEFSAFLVSLTSFLASLSLAFIRLTFVPVFAIILLLITKIKKPNRLDMSSIYQL
ncbi:Uncharacterised protein [Chlamydia trachomatis]|nr:Uncharacterised protein [Chlamydia trachomatis]